MIEIATSSIEEAVYYLCKEANICLDSDIYNKILNAYKDTGSVILKSILQNAKIAFKKERPLCQDTGQVIIFCEMGQEVHLNGDFIETVINRAVEKCYNENFF